MSHGNTGNHINWEKTVKQLKKLYMMDNLRLSADRLKQLNITQLTDNKLTFQQSGRSLELYRYFGREVAISLGESDSSVEMILQPQQIAVLLKWLNTDI
jgi:hypothetical protein